MYSKYLFRIVCLSMLVAIGVTAMSAQAAHAKWVILRDGKTVIALKLEGELEKGVLLEEGGLEIDTLCKVGTVTATAASVESGKKITVESAATFVGCDVVGSSVCTVNSPGEPDGTIKAKGLGELKMKGSPEEVYAGLESQEFTKIIYGNLLCPFNEVEAVVDGSVTLTIHNHLEHATQHTVLLNEQSLDFGGNNATLHDDMSPSSAVRGLMEETTNTGIPWSFHLEGL